MTSSLTFKNLTWEEFQQLTVYLAEEHFPDVLFEEYLKKGHKQHGIDILAFDKKIGKHFSIQCKHEKSLSIKQLKTIVEEFENGKFIKTSSDFLLATTADLQSPVIRDYIELQKFHFKEHYNILFSCWDVNTFNSQLVKYYRIVHRFFGMAEADLHCFKSILQNPRIKPQSNYITCKISSIIKEQEDNAWSYTTARKAYTLSDIIIDNPLTSKKICLIADAYEGKSILLKQTGYELSNSSMPYEIIIIELKSVNIRPIADILESNYSTWKSVPSKDLVIIIDGLDEVATDKFIEAVDYIKEFTNTFSSVHVVFSCRKLFYHHYELNKKLHQVEFYQLNELSNYEIHKYLESVFFGKQIEEFTSKIQKLDIESFLHLPFYLINLTQWYLHSPKNLPTSKIDIVTKFIDESLRISSDRKLSKGNAFSQKKVSYRKNLKNLALALQLAGTNSVDDEFIQSIFDIESIELLQHSSLLSISNENWSFNSALFQEQLAALALIEFDIQNILDFISVGENIKKVRTKWLQTIASVISLLEESDPKRTDIINLIEQDNIELLALSDGAKFSNEFRLNVVKKIIEKCILLNIRLVLIHENAISSFTGNDPAVIDFLLLTLQEDVYQGVKIVICRILKLLKLQIDEQEVFRILALEELKTLTNPYYGKLLLDILTYYKISGTVIIEQIFKRNDLVTSYEFRNGIYKYLIAQNLVDEYYDFGLAGIQILIDHNKSISHHGSERRLEEFLLSTKKPKNLENLYKHIQSPQWLGFYGFRSDSIVSFVKKLEEITTIIYQEKQSIIFSVLSLVRALGRRSIKDEYSNINNFFFNTSTNLMALKLFLVDHDHSYQWEFSDILNDDCLIYLIYAHEDGYITRATLDSFLTGLQYKKRNKEAEKLDTLIIQAFGKPKEQNKKIHNFYKKVEEVKFRNDIKYIQSHSSFKEGIINYFKAFGKNELPYRELYIDHRSKPKRISTNSTIMHDFLSQEMRNNEEITLVDCLKSIDDEEDFNFIRAKLILNFNYKGRTDEVIFKNILSDYFHKEMKTASFTNLYSQTGNRLTYKVKEVMLSEIWRKFIFELSDELLVELIWADKNGIKGIEHNRLNKRVSIASLLLEKFSGKEALLKKTIISNFSIGFECEMVLGSHIGLCRHLNMHEAADIILDYIISGKLKNELYHAIDTFIELCGDTEKLLPLFISYRDYNDYCFSHIIKILYHHHKAEVANVLLLCMEDPQVTEENKLNFAKYLAVMGYENGFEYLVSKVKTMKRAPYYTQSGFNIFNVDTAKGLAQIEDILYMILDDEDDFNRFDTAKSFLLEVINGFASKGEKDLLMVVDFIKKNILKLEKDYKNTHYLSWHLEQIIENFRNDQNRRFTVQQIKELIA